MSDNQITGFNPGAMKYPSEYKLEDADFKNSIVLIAPGNLQDMIEYAEICREKGIRYVCDPGQSLSKWEGKALRDWIDGSMLLITNDYEMELVIKMTGMDKSRLLGLTKRIVTTLGQKGSVILSPDDELYIPSAKVNGVVDPTGAGDAFMGALLASLCAGKSAAESLRMANIVGALSTTERGAISGLPHL